MMNTLLKQKKAKQHILLWAALLSSSQVYASTYDPDTQTLTVDSIVVNGITYAAVNVALSAAQVSAATQTGTSINSTTNTYDPATRNLALYFVQNLKTNEKYYNVQANIQGDSITPVCSTPTTPATVTPNDPLFNNQWHLLNTGQPASDGTKAAAGEDLKITDAWSQATGCGIRIAIVDDGLDLKHEDLNVDIANSYDFAAGASVNDTHGTGISFAVPAPNGAHVGAHGTAVAGLAAAKGNNNVGVTGTAYNATVVGYNWLAGNLTDADLLMSAQRGLTGTQYNHIYNNSWGDVLTGMLASAPSKWSVAIASGHQSGRGGLGAIYTFAAGNGGYNFRSNYSGYPNDDGVFAIAALNENGKRASYSSPGANILVSAFGGEGCSKTSQATTTTDIMSINPAWGYNKEASANVEYDYSGKDYSTKDNPSAYLNYTRCMDGTSAATPEASGVIALMLEANSALSWRDVRWILATTARQNDPTDPGWMTNKAGYKVNDSYGFGAINATAAVKQAKNWTTLLPSQTTSTKSSSLSTPKAIADGTQLVTDAASKPANFDTQAAAAYYGTATADTITLINAPQINKLEFVELKVTSDHPEFGDLQITLTSPSGTTSTVARRHPCYAGDAYIPCGAGLKPGDYVFGITQFLGETADGDWIINIADGNGNKLTGTLQSWGIKVYGYE